MKRALIVMALALAGCQSANEPGQVVARVNGREIAVHQFNLAVKRAGSAAASQEVRRELARKVVDRELAMQQALSLKLDREPEVMFQLEEARREVLARAYAERVAAERAAMGRARERDAAARYYDEHPELFARRKIYRLREIALSPGLERTPEALAVLAAGRPVAELLAWLRSEKVDFASQFVIRAAEQLPIEAVPKLAAAAQGQSVVFESPRGIVVYQVLQTQEAPLAWEKAAPMVMDYLLRREGKEAMDAEMSRLRNRARIEHFGDFAQLLSSPARAD